MSSNPAPNCAGKIDVPECFVPEPAYRMARFAEFAPQLIGRRIAIYGTGANAQRILEGEFGIDIVAVVDDHAVGSRFCGFEVVCTEQLPPLGVSAAVIGAPLQSGYIVYKRTSAYCAAHGIAVYCMYGNDMREMDEQLDAYLEAPLARRLAQISRCGVLAVGVNMMPFSTPGKSVDWCLAHDGRLTSCIGDVLAYADALGKEVVFFSDDSSVTSEVMDGLVSRSGYDGVYRTLLSADTGLYVASGLLRVLSMVYPGESVAVVGTDVFANGLVPTVFGFYPVASDDLRCPEWLIQVRQGEQVPAPSAWTPGEAVPASILASDADVRLAGCLQEAFGKLSERGSRSDAAVACVIGPVVVGFVLWLAERLRAGRYDGVLFTARDSWIVKGVYDLLRDSEYGGSLPPSTYLYASRLAGERALHDDEQRRGAFAYLASCGLILGGTYAFVDFVGAGTCQRQLEEYVPFALDGFYFGSRVGDALESGLAAHCRFHDEAGLVGHYLFFEPYMSSVEPSLAGFSPDGKPLFSSEPRSDTQLEILESVHRGVLQFATDYLARWYEAGDAPTTAFLDGIAPAIAACAHPGMELFDDLRDQACLASSLHYEAVDLPPSEPKAPARDVHRVLLDLLAAFDEVCRSFGLTYIATHGTLLGAVRHAGFVPWDDDLDVAMPRADYDKLLQLAAADVFPEPYFLQTPENEPSCFFGGYAKLRDSSTSAIEPDYEGFTYNQGIWIDILPLDTCPIEQIDVEKHQRIVRQWQRVLYAQSYKERIRELWDVKVTRLSAYFIAAKHLKRAFLCKQLRKTCMACKNTGMLTVFAANYQWMRNNVRYAADDVDRAVLVPFEDTEIPIPAHSEKWLAVHYGDDWSVEPDESQRQPRHDVEFDPSTPYREKLVERGVS